MTELPLNDLSPPLRREHPLAEGLAAWWLPLAGLDGGRRLYDLCGVNHAALTYPGTTTRLWVAGGYAQGLAALQFDRTTAYRCTAAYSPRLAVATGDFTVVSWENHGSTSTYMPSFARDDGNGKGVVFFGRVSTNGVMRYFVGSGYKDTGTLPTNTWVCRVLVRRGGVCTEYLNGLPTGQTWTAAGSVDQVAHPVDFGWLATSASYRFTGRLGGAAWYRRALSAAEVRALYDEGRRGYPTLLRRVRVPVGRGVVLPPAAAVWLVQASGAWAAGAEIAGGAV